MNLDESERLDAVLGMAATSLLVMDEQRGNALRSLLADEVKGDPSFGDDAARVENVIEKLVRRVGQIFAVDKPAADPEMASLVAPTRHPITTRPAKELAFGKRR